MLKSDHQKRVEQFMTLAQQGLPDKPTEPTEAVRLLRAKLIFEEAMETIEKGLGIKVRFSLHGIGQSLVYHVADKPHFEVVAPFDMVETIDGCTDLSVVTTGTLSACGVPDLPFLKLIDKNNLAKFSEGHSIREDGKLVKPPGHKPPDIEGVLQVLSQKWKTS